MRLIDADALIEAMKKTESEYENAMTCPSWWSAFNVISEQPTAYDIDKVVEELERIRAKETCNKEKCDTKEICRICVVDDAIEIVKQVAEEYNGGWIPCSERLPEDDSICTVTVEYPNNETVVDYGWFDRKNVCWFVGMQEFRTSNIIAWQPLPEPYKECD